MEAAASKAFPEVTTDCSLVHPLQYSHQQNVTVISIANTTECTMSDTERKVMLGILIAIYAAVFVGGACGTFVMSCNLYKTNVRSVNATMIINLCVVHCIFLLTVPFRIIYYYKEIWTFGTTFCRIASAMIHIHMYLSFIFYITLFVSRFLIFFKRRDKVEFYRMLHAVSASVAVWLLFLIIFVPILVSQYGNSGDYQSCRCFNFQWEFQKPIVVIVNYIVVAAVLIVVCILLCVQIFIVAKVVKSLQGQKTADQDFLAQVKSLFSILALIVSFFPYHLFRIYYITHSSDCRSIFYNEICLSLTAMSCLEFLLLTTQNYCWKRQITCCTQKNKRVYC